MVIHNVRWTLRVLLVALLTVVSLTACSSARSDRESSQGVSATNTDSIAAPTKAARATTSLTSEVYGLDLASPKSLAIQDALRPQVEKALGQPVSFDVGFMNEWGNYVTVQGIALGSNGREIDYSSIAPYSEAVKAGAFDPQLYALLRNDGGRWRVLKWEVGATDAAFLPWSDEFGLPDDIWTLKLY